MPGEAVLGIWLVLGVLVLLGLRDGADRARAQARRRGLFFVVAAAALLSAVQAAVLLGDVDVNNNIRGLVSAVGACAGLAGIGALAFASGGVGALLSGRDRED
jgi:hypothetical protein